jgi:putative intracellular protease/amidase/YHS domain-containing protein
MRRRLFSRRDVLEMSAAAGFITATTSLLGSENASAAAADVQVMPGAQAPPLTPPASGKIPVAFLISDGAVMIDFAGPWEVFQDTMNPATKDEAFHLYTVAETSHPIRVSGGMKVVADYTMHNAPQPRLLVIPAQSGESSAMLKWITEVSKHTDVTMSVCTGAFLLAKTGLLDGKAATTHHAGYIMFANQYPAVQLKRGLRYVEAGNLASAGGLSSGIDLALRVVERYFGREAAQQTAYNMEYQGRGWLDPGLNSIYASSAKSTDAHPLCPVCGMDADRAIATKYRSKTYYFCMREHERLFEATPDKFTS